MRKIIPLLTLALALTALSGCAATASSAGSGPSGAPSGASSAGATGGSSGSGSGSGATSATECAIAHDALSKFVAGPLSAPYQKDETCYFGVGPNGSKTGTALMQIFGDSVNVRLVTTNVGDQYQAANIAYGGSQPLAGVGSEAKFYDGGNGNPQVFARTSKAFCDVQTNFNDASEVGLTKPSGSRTIAEVDVPKLASSVGAVCTALFGG